MQIIFIGGGNIAEAIFSKLKDTKEEIIVVQRNLDKRTILAAKYPYIRFLPSLDITPEINDLVIMAVKPHDAKELCQNLPKIDCTIISVMTGISTKTLSKWLDNKKIGRLMPNTAANVGLSVNGLYFGDGINKDTRQRISSILNNMGKTYIFDNEEFIDKITPVSGSAPAYVFYFIEAMTNVAVKEFGFSKQDALDMTLQVFKGSIALIENNPDIEVKQLRSNVTSKNGTTEQAINVFEKANLTKIIVDAELACYKRAIAIANSF